MRLRSAVERSGRRLLSEIKGIAQIRSWGHRAGGEIEEAFRYEQLQADYYVPFGGTHSIRLVLHRQYLEFSMNGYVLLTLADNEYERGRVGFYVENAELILEKVTMKVCGQPAGESYPHSMANY